MHRIHLSAPDIGTAEQAAVARAMSSGWVAPVGPELDAFEGEVAGRIGVAHGVAVSSGTAALHLSLLAAGVGPGMIVPTSTMTFAATANAIMYTGATPLFIDCDRPTGNLDVALLADAVSECVWSGQRVGAIVPVDIYGKSADYTAIEAIAARHGIPIIADSAESLGASHAGRPAGSFGVAAAVSFNGNKIMTTSGGGMVLTDDATLAETARRLATQARLPVAHYEHAEVGYNYRLSNVLAALGRAQLERLDEMIERRRQIRHRYREVVADAPGVHILGAAGDDVDNCWLTSIVLSPSSDLTPEHVARALDDDCIETRRLWNPMHRQPVFTGLPQVTSGVADDLFRTGLSLPSGSSMTDSDIDRVCLALSTVLGGRRVRA